MALPSGRQLFDTIQLESGLGITGFYRPWCSHPGMGPSKLQRLISSSFRLEYLVIGSDASCSEENCGGCLSVFQVLLIVVCHPRASRFTSHIRKKISNEETRKYLFFHVRILQKRSKLLTIGRKQRCLVYKVLQIEM